MTAVPLGRVSSRGRRCGCNSGAPVHFVKKTVATVTVKTEHPITLLRSPPIVTHNVFASLRNAGGGSGAFNAWKLPGGSSLLSRYSGRDRPILLCLRTALCLTDGGMIP